MNLNIGLFLEISCLVVKSWSLKKLIIKRVGLKIFGIIERIGTKPEDTDEICLQKSLLVISTLFLAFLGFNWGLIYFYFGELLAGAIPFSYAIFSFISIGVFVFTCNIRIFRVNQLVLSMLLPFFLMIALGGFMNGSAVIMWSFCGPLGAIFFSDYKKSYRWFLAYFGLLVLSGIMQPYFLFTTRLPPFMITLFFIMNITGMSVLTFLMIYYYINQNKKVISLLQRIITCETDGYSTPAERESIMKDYIEEAVDMIKTMF